MAKGKRTPQVPGAAQAADPEDRTDAPPAAKAVSAGLKVLHPAIQSAVADATKMSHADAVKAEAEGALNRRVLTEKGWYIPNADRKVG